MMTGIGTPRSQSRIAGIDASIVLQRLNASSCGTFPFHLGGRPHFCIFAKVEPVRPQTG